MLILTRGNVKALARIWRTEMFDSIKDSLGRIEGRWQRAPWRVGGVVLLALLLAAAVACSDEPEPTPVPPTATPTIAAPTMATPTVAREPEPQMKNIVDIAAGDENFETLVAALLQAADLVDVNTAGRGTLHRIRSHGQRLRQAARRHRTGTAAGPDSADRHPADRHPAVPRGRWRREGSGGRRARISRNSVQGEPCR